MTPIRGKAARKGKQVVDMPRVVHFEIPADDTRRALEFYKEVFGWNADKWGGPMEYYLLSTKKEGEEGIDGAIMPRDETSPHIVNILDVPSVDEFMERVVAHGGKLMSPKIPVPGVGWVVYVSDTEGNLMGMMERDENAQ